MQAFKAETGFVPGLAVVLVGDDPASAVYVRNKGKQTVEAGMNSFEHKLPADTAQADLIALVERLNADDSVDGILVQLPLPGHLDELAVVSAINPDKDVDGLHVVSAGRLASGLPGLISCTPLGCMMLIRDTLNGDLSGKEAVVIGRSILVGKPVARYSRPIARSRWRIAGPRTWLMSCVARILSLLLWVGPKWSRPTGSSRAPA